MQGWMQIAVVAAAISSVLPSGQNRIETKRIGPAAWQITLTAPGVTDPAEGQLLLMPTARELCGSEQARLGRYRFNATEELAKDGTRRPGTLTMIQTLDCGAPPAETSTAPPQDTSEVAKNDADIISLTDAYLGALAQGDPAVSFDLASEGIRGGRTLDAWSKLIAADRKRAGQAGERRIVRVTWYENPPDAPEPGIYAAADYVASAEKLYFECGYVVWFWRDGRFRAVRHEKGVASKNNLKKATSQQLAQYRAMLRCTD
jgi:hypothetical protein